MTQESQLPHNTRISVNIGITSNIFEGWCEYLDDEDPCSTLSDEAQRSAPITSTDDTSHHNITDSEHQQHPQ